MRLGPRPSEEESFVTARQIVKRGLKWAVEWGMASFGLGFLYRRSRTFREGFRILTYHKVSDDLQDSYTVRTTHFRDHMAWLADNFRVVSLEEAAEPLCSGTIPDENTVAVTFDDGYFEAATLVRETLEKYSIPATFFVVTRVLDRNGNAANSPFMTWNQVRQLADAGFSIGSHTMSHLSLGELGPSEVRKQLVRSRERILQELGIAPKGLSYPYGTARDVSLSIAGQAAEAGYDYAVTALHGLNHAGCNAFMLRRTTIGAGDGLRTFRMILRGNLDPWAFVDRWGYRFQRVRKWEESDDDRSLP